MQITICRADCAGNARNCRYPTKVVVADAGMMKDAAAYDHVCGEYRGGVTAPMGISSLRMWWSWIWIMTIPTIRRNG